MPKDPIVVYEDQLWKIHSHVGYFATKHFNYYGIVNYGNRKLVIGPTRQVANSEQELRELAFRVDVPVEETEAFITGMKNIVRMPVESVLQILCTFNYILNDEKLTLEDMTITDAEQSEWKRLLETQRSESKMDSFSEEMGNPNVYTSFDYEKQMLHMVSNGNVDELKKWISSSPDVRGGTLAKDQLRQIKNTFIVSATLVSRAAIQGGMDVQDALSLSDAFIQKAELTNSTSQLTNLQYYMVMDFTERVEKIRHGKEPTALVLSVTNYVHHHISDSIRARDIAEALYLSRPYLSSKFREETGQSLTDFILSEKQRRQNVFFIIPASLLQ